MRLNGIVEINETEKLNVPIGAVFKVNLAVPHIHQCADNPLGFTVGLRTIDTGKLLTDTLLPASFDESVAVSSFKFFAVVRISIVDLVRTLSNSSDEKASCTMLGFIGKNIGYSSLEKSSMATNRYSRGSLANCPFNNRSRLVSK
jgi:hypothetical protein